MKQNDAMLLWLGCWGWNLWTRETGTFSGLSPIQGGQKILVTRSRIVLRTSMRSMLRWRIWKIHLSSAGQFNLNDMEILGVFYIQSEKMNIPWNLTVPHNPKPSQWQSA